ncbi:sterol desaturase family protein [Actinophytocola oryzae]|nr:sterol desaturase family protein [Actinophytocola oryzae]
MSDRPNTGAYPVLRRVAYPVLLAAVLVVATAALRLDWDPAVVSPLFLVGAISYLAVLERLIPYQPAWRPDRREWGWYGVYFVLTMVSAAIAQTLVTMIVVVVSPLDPALPPQAEIPAALLVGSLGSYLMHRLGHTNPWLWRFHGVHHVPEKVNVGNNGVNHVFDIVISQGVVQLALAVAGFSAPSVLVVGLFVAAQGYFIHANIDVRIGWLNYLLVSPEQHRLHHSTDLAEAGHYGSDLAFWDKLFGSFTWYPGREPVAVGLSDPTSFPPTGALVTTFTHPWRRRTPASSSDPARPG